jgi:hypothetical protein
MFGETIGCATDETIGCAADEQVRLLQEQRAMARVSEAWKVFCALPVYGIRRCG